jgi:hypothetical protein
MMNQSRLLMVGAVVAGSLIGAGTAVAVNGDRSVEQTSTRLVPQDCESGMMSAGLVDSLLPSEGGELETRTPQELASAYIEDAVLSKSLPDVTTNVDQVSETEASVTILSAETVIGQLTYIQYEGSWATDTVQVCAPRTSADP